MGRPGKRTLDHRFARDRNSGLDEEYSLEIPLLSLLYQTDLWSLVWCEQLACSFHIHAFCPENRLDACTRGMHEHACSSACVAHGVLCQQLVVHTAPQISD